MATHWNAPCSIGGVDWVTANHIKPAVANMNSTSSGYSGKGYYVVAEGNGGGEVNCNRTAIGPWETFTLVK
jgi:hypothetical protein